MINEPRSEQQAAQPVTPSPEGGALSGQGLDPIIPVLKQVVQEALEEHRRREQSIRDKMEARIQKRVQELEETMRQLVGQELTQEQRETLRTIAAKNVQSEMETESHSPAQPSAPAAPSTDANPLERLILRKFQKTGVFIEDGDPELAYLAGADFEDLDDLNARLDQAIQAKKQRLQSQPSELNPSTSAGRTPLVSGQPANLEAEYYKELEKARGNIDAIWAIKQKYRKLGLKV
jgi:hypothetical protein